MRIGINGFGRIGRSIFRAWLHTLNDNNPESNNANNNNNKNKNDLQIVAINNLADTQTSAYLANFDSIHGRAIHPIQIAADDTLQVYGRTIHISHEREPTKIPWDDHAVDLVFECTGVFTQRQSASQHLRHSNMAVIISAPGTDPDLTVVYGVNHHLITGTEQIISNASCTTNCLAPICQVIHDKFGINQATMSTVHAITNDQKIMDSPHKDLRRGRASSMSMIPTTTGAAKMVAQVLPELAGKLDGMAIRVPTTNVSLTDLVISVPHPTTAEQINQALSHASHHELAGIVETTHSPLVSSDYNGCKASAVVDLPLTKVVDKTLVKLLLWYDNETAFSWRMLDVARAWQSAKLASTT